MNGYLIPANTKKSTLILGFLRGIDAIILASGVVATVIAVVALGNINNTWLLLLACMPAAVCGLLVLPIPNYHNTLVAIQSIMRYFRETRNYKWKGWCIYNESDK